MLSICIPVYNFDVSKLVLALQKEIFVRDLKADVEVILIDDGSERTFLEANRQSLKHLEVVYLELEHNIGRSKIRNLFLSHSKYNNLLFLDCDSLIVKSDFILTYLKVLQAGNKVVCGGRDYGEVPASRKKFLRWKYGSSRESKSANDRRLEPHISFLTNNFCVSKSVLISVKFDERISQYGHEDTLFGFELKKKGIDIVHIENPVLNGDIEDGEVFFKKTELGLISLWNVYQFLNYSNEFSHYVKILRMLNTLDRYKLLPLIQVFFALFGKTIRNRLIEGKVNLKMFDFYKLGYLASHR